MPSRPDRILEIINGPERFPVRRIQAFLLTSVFALTLLTLWSHEAVVKLNSGRPEHFVGFLLLSLLAGTLAGLIVDN